MRYRSVLMPSTVPGRQLVFLTTGIGVGGGAEQQVRSLALTLRQRGWRVAVISMLPVEWPFRELDEAGVEVTTLGMTRGVPDPRALLRLRTRLRRLRPDVLHGHMVHANLLARLSRLSVRIPVVVSTMHNQDEGAQWRYVAYRLTDRLSDLTTTVSRVAADEAIRRGAVRDGRILVVPNGIPTFDYRPDRRVRERTRGVLGLAGEFTWLAVGRLTAAKAYPDMIAAFEQVRQAERDSVLLVAGTGPLESEVTARIHDAGLDGRIRPLGLRTDVGALMQAADGFVMSSAWEGLPLALLEASASSLPVVATDVGGTRDAVLDGVTGYVTPRNDPAVLARAMLTVMSLSNAERQAMGGAGRSHVERVFELEHVADRWEQLYGQHLARASRRSGLVGRRSLP